MWNVMEEKCTVSITLLSTPFNTIALLTRYYNICSIGWHISHETRLSKYVAFPHLFIAQDISHVGLPMRGNISLLMVYKSNGSDKETAVST